VFVTDLKGELYELTAGWRQEYAHNKVLRFEPAASAGSCCFNPMAELRIGMASFRTGPKMTSDSMLPRFEGEEGKRRLVDALQKQSIVGGDSAIAAEIDAAVSLQEHPPGAILIRDGAADNDLFFIVTGSFRIVVNGRDVAIRKQGHHVGEMALIDSSAPRSASVIAAERSIVAKISEQDFMRLANSQPQLWRFLAIELCHRLIERRKFHREPNLTPVVFIGSSKEQIAFAEAIKKGIPVTVADTIIWSENVFTASSYVLESLERSFSRLISRCWWLGLTMK
jgi:CRP-like cAMP-binding protein